MRRVLGRQAGAQADEVFQDTWLRVVNARERWAPQGATFRTWLFTLAHHRAIDLLRKSGREVAFDHDGDAREPWQPALDGAWHDWPAAGAALDSAHEQVFWRAAGQRLLTA
jgi:RNA polymerase sigma-70 factor (ECF subfamily)